MAICVAVNSEGHLVQSVSSIESCMGHILLNIGEYQNITLQHTVLAIPETSDFAAAWAAGFILPCTVGLIAYCVGQIVKVWNK